VNAEVRWIREAARRAAGEVGRYLKPPVLSVVAIQGYLRRFDDILTPRGYRRKWHFG